MISTLLFCVLCVLGAGMVYWHRTASGTQRTGPHLLWAIVFSSTAAALLWTGSTIEYGKRLTITTKELRLPTQSAQEDGTYFVVGPRAEDSDLVVGPYADPTRSAEVYREELDDLLTIKREGNEWFACGRSVPALEEANLPGMRVKFDGEPVAAEPCRALSAEPLTALVERTGDGANQKRRHLYLSKTQSDVRIRFKSDERLVSYVGRCSDLLGQDSTASNNGLRLAPAGLHREDMGYRVPSNFVIDQLGQGQANPFLSPRILGPIGNMAQLCGNVRQDFTWPSGETPARLVMTANTTRMSWWIAGLVLLCTVWTARVCQSQWRDGPGLIEGALVIGLQWLLTLRLIVAMSGFPNDPNLTLTNVLWPPSIALICAPLIAIALLRGYTPETRQTMGLLALLVPLGYLITLWGLDWQQPGTQEALLAGITIIFLGARAFIRTPQSLAIALISLVSFLLTTIGIDRIVAKILNRDGQSGKLGIFQMGLILAGTAFALRFAVGGIGKLSNPPVWQERFSGIPFIENLPLSLVYAPVAIVAMAMMIEGYRQLPRFSRAFLLSGAFAAVFLGIAIWVRDLGLILIFAAPVAWVIAKLAAVEPDEGAAKGMLARLFLIGPLISPFLLLGGLYWYSATEVPSPREDLQGHMAAAAQWDANLVRLQRYIDPDQLISVGNTQALGMLEQAAQLEPITSDMIGHGYMMPSGIVHPLLKYQYSDNLLAVQIAWPFGRMGLAVLLGALLVTLLGIQRQTAQGPNARWMVQMSTLAAMTLFWSGAYMALANLNLVPFTGRNFYLLAARSMGDLAEGLVLFLMVALPFVALPRNAKSADTGSGEE